MSARVSELAADRAARRELRDALDELHAAQVDPDLHAAIRLAAERVERDLHGQRARRSRGRQRRQPERGDPAAQHAAAAGRRQRLQALAEARDDDLPLVFVPDSEVLRSPTTLDLAASLGLRTRALQPLYDLCIVGSGPAGLAAAVYAASEGLDTVVVEGLAPGGQAGTSSKIENYLGFPTGISGADLVWRGEVQASGLPGEVFRDAALLRECHLRQPWLVALHSETGLPLFRTPRALFNHLKGHHRD